MAHRQKHAIDGGEAFPLVHRFRTRRQQYVFDTNTKRILAVSPSIWHALGSRRSWLAMDDATKAAVAATRRKGLLGEPPTAVVPCSRERVSQGLESQREQLILNVTERCNYRCSYCPIHGAGSSGRGRHSSMKIEVAVPAIEEFLAHASPKARVITFYGGEPLLELALIRRLVKFIRSRTGEDVQFGMTTNAWLLTGQAAAFLADEGFFLTVSLDGPREMHDRNRIHAGGQGTWSRCMRNIRGFLDRYPQYASNSRLRFNAVATDQTDFEQVQAFIDESDIFTSAMEYSISYRKLRSLDDGWPKGSACDLSWRRLYRRFKRRLAGGDFERMLKSPSQWVENSLFMRPFLTFHKRGLRDGPAPSPLQLLNTCIPGARRAFVDCQGNYYPCERVAATVSQRIGHVSSGLDARLSHELISQWTKATDVECASCWCLMICQTGCFATVDDMGCSMQLAKRSGCHRHRAQMHQLLKAYCEILEKNPKSLDFLNQVELS